MESRCIFSPAGAAAHPEREWRTSLTRSQLLHLEGIDSVVEVHPREYVQERGRAGRTKETYAALYSSP